LAHRFDIRFLRPIAEEEVHQVRNFIEDLWARAAREGWVDLAQLDQRFDEMEDFVLTIPARQSYEAQKIIEGLVAAHFMEHFVRVTHHKGGRDG